MALKATIYKANIHVSDMDRNYYDTINITIAQHPSETDRRMMVRILAYILNLQEHIQFTKGLSEDDEPEIWVKDFSEVIKLWIDLGQIDEKRIKKGCNHSHEMKLYSYGSGVDIWWSKTKNKVSNFKNLSVVKIDDDTCEQLATLVSRTMELNCTIDSGQIWLGNDQTTVHIDPQTLYPEH